MKHSVLLAFLLIWFSGWASAQNYACYQQRIGRAKAAYNSCDYRKALKWIESITTDQCVVPAKNEIKSLTAKINAGMGDNCDNDGDGIVNHVDKCPTTAGPKSNDGCPETGPKQFAFTERFEDNRNNWPLKSFSKISSGKLWFMDTMYFRTTARTYNIDCSRDFSCSAQVSLQSEENTEGGIVFAEGDSASYYFVVSADGNYSVEHYSRKTSFKKMIDWTFSGDIRTGSAPNMLSVEKTGDFIVFYINGKAQDTLPFADARGNRFGFCISGKGSKVVEFDDFNLQGTTRPPANFRVANSYAFTDYFLDNANGWSLSNDANKKITIDGGKLVVEGLSNSYSYGTTKFHRVDISKDFDCYVEFSILKTAGVGAGLIFCEGSGKSYAFLVSDTRHFSISKLENKRWESIVDWTPLTSSFNAAQNKLLIKKRGRSISFYLNDSLLTTLPFTSNAGSYFGLRTERNQTVHFDNFMLTGERL